MKKTKKPHTTPNESVESAHGTPVAGAASREEAIADTMRQLKTLAGSLTKWNLTPDERETIKRHITAALG